MQTTFKEHTIEVTPAMRFRITAGPFFDGGRTIERASFDEIKDYIDRREKERDREKRVKLDLLSLTDDGKPVTITGINAHTMRLNGLGNTNSDVVYPHVTWIAETIEKIKKLKKERNELLIKIDKYAIPVSYGRQFYGDDKYEAAVKKLVAEHAQKMREAEKNKETIT